MTKIFNRKLNKRKIYKIRNAHYKNLFAVKLTIILVIKITHLICSCKCMLIKILKNVKYFLFKFI